MTFPWTAAACCRFELGSLLPSNHAETSRSRLRDGKRQQAAAVHVACDAKDDLHDSTLFDRRHSLNRRVLTAFVLPLHGQTFEMSDAQSAIAYLQGHDQADVRPEFTRYEIIVRFNNGDEIRGQFQS